ncbi:dmX-like protein 1 isoform X7 [Ahaetulla prasina]|uniref:dmX-like protein 1 isoform X7 n=1 Tax=Ahaetulla prasina TaxID=499056 RepID=UPI002647ADF3|nr:dmX-like protein 1 isoform X7 [Ahaetulla prasina]
MNLHQVLTGAVNPGDNCFSVGNVDGHPFTAYASGCDIVILGTDFERLQIIPGAKYGNIQVGCVDCSMQQGKIAATYGNIICIFEPIKHLKQKKNHNYGLFYQWQNSDQICLEHVVHNLTWDPTGSRLLTSSSCLQLWSNISFENLSENENHEKADTRNWKIIWQSKTASQVHLMMFSPDGEFFATAGKDDCLVKVWYNTDCWKSVIASQHTTPETTVQELSFSFIYLVHPRSVDGFSWRKTSNYMPRGAVCNVLLTSCKDNICRLWAETLLPNDSLLYEGGYNHWPEPVKLNNFKRNASSKESMKNALELNLRPFRRGRRRSIALAHTGYLPHQQDPHVVHRNSPLQSNALCHFHIAASINPATDIPLLPSIMSLSLNESEEKSGPFVVHWLNNKELHFTLSMEVFLQQFKRNFEHISSEASTEEPNQMTFRSDEETDDSREEQRRNQEQKEFPGEKPVLNSSSIPLSSAVIDHEIEIQLAEWNKNADMLFSIHPMDGSLLVWHVDWLDEYQPGMFRQVQVSFVSRIPVAFPTGDANSLCRSIVMYACTKNVDLALQQGKQKPSSLGRSCSMLISSGHSKSPNNVKLSIFTPNVMMISKHADGSLNQWLVSFAEESAFSNVLSICHKSRYCGHRFHLNDLACHSVLPLLLTTSHHNAVRIPVLDSTEEASPEHQNKSSACTSQDLTAVYSELILWRVDPVGPLSFSGGVSELARINSLHVSAFSNVAWLPCLIPSYCLGAYCNSPSACFVASDGQHLRLYQAIIDAKKLLCELSNPGISDHRTSEETTIFFLNRKYVGKFFNIISQQSTARPGCIVELNSITELHGEKMQLLHVFQEDFIMNNLENRFSEKESILLDPGYQENGFSEKFYLIVIEYTQNCSLLHMWKLHLKSLPVSVDEKIAPKASETASQEQLHSSPDQEKLHSSFTKKYQVCRDNLQSTSQLVLSSEIVYSRELNLPEGVEIVSIKPSAGHLSSSSIYPVRQAPYLLATLCSDGKVRFWRCRMAQETDVLAKPENTKNSGGETLDECGLKFLLAVRLHTFMTTSLPPAHRAQLLYQGLSSSHFAWAFHSIAEEELLNMLPAIQKGDPTWSELRAMGIGWWVRNTHNLRRCIEKVAKAAFQRNNDPLDAAIFYLAMKKKTVIWGLYRSLKDTKMTQFFGNNFTEDRWRKAALKNAFSLLGKQRFEHSTAFFLLAGHLKDAIEVCLEKLNDIQLALVIARLYESEFETSGTYKSILQKKILGSKPHSTESPSKPHFDPFLRSMAYWILEEYGHALDTLLSHPTLNDEDEGSFSNCSPSVFNFYNYLRTHPLLLRRHFGSSDLSSTRICVTGENGLADEINLEERKLFFTAAYTHLKSGCPMLALEVLSKMPKVVKKSKCLRRTFSLRNTSKECSPSSPMPVESKDGQFFRTDKSEPVLNGLGSFSDVSPDKHSDSDALFDWSQPAAVFQDDPLELKWDSGKDEESEDSCLAMKPLQKITGEKTNEISSSCTETYSSGGENDVLASSEDIICVQLKFRACLKILTEELRTLSTGYEVDGGKLRYQLYNWLEREVVALQKTCEYNIEADDSQREIIPVMGENSLNDKTEDLSDMHLKENIQRRHWLIKYQSLLRMFLSYCILHGSHGGGLASVRMELILLLQESQQEFSEQSYSNIVSEQNTIPLLFACTASAKTVVANPLLHLSNLTHDILHAIISLDSPPHPDVQNNKIQVMHTLAASLSACIYQSLCGGHNYSLLQANQFTGMIYQTLLLSHRHSLRTASSDETITPNTTPAQWPGIMDLIQLLNQAGEEAQSGITVLLCEILTAIYLSLFIHGLATHSSNELFRIVAHPLNDKMWFAVFGGGAKIPKKGPIQETTKMGRHFSMPSPHQVVVFSMECVGFTKSLTTISTHSPTKLAASSPIDDGEKQNKRFRLSSKSSSKENSPTILPGKEQDFLIYKEKFIPPELSIWDYFIAKPYLGSSQTRFEYDSDESQDSSDEDEDEDGAFFSDSKLQEHSNSNSFSWSLMRLAMVQLVLRNLKSFYPLAGHDLTELPVCSPLCHAVLKALQRWEQVLLRRLEMHGGPPENFISIHILQDTSSSGPALLRHKVLLEPTNTPFKSKSHYALSVKRLWQYLVKQEMVQETFIRNIFAKRKCLNESLEDQAEFTKTSSGEESGINKIEHDAGSPGSKARIIHKESDIITAFAVNKANRNCIAIASSHEIQELDVSGILATQIYTWVDDDIEVEAKGPDDFLVIHARDDLGNIQGTTPYTHSTPGTPINMPWLGSTQTGRGAAMMIKKNLNNVRRMASHPTLPYYLTGAQDGSVRMFEWGHSQQLACFRSGGNSRITRMRFNYQGNKFGIVDGDGHISLYQTNCKGCLHNESTPKPYLTWQCHNKTASDFVFISSSSLIATAGLSTDNRNICLWDTLVAPSSSLVHAFTCHDTGATVLAYAPKHQLLLSGGRRGYTCLIDLRQKQQRQFFQSHDSPVKAIAVDPTEEYFVTGSAEGNIKVWSLSNFSLLHTFLNEHSRQSIFRNLGTGVMQIETGPANHIFSCGADGTVKMRILPDQFNSFGEVLKTDVKYVF